MRDEKEFFEFERGGDGQSAESGKIILVGAADKFDEAVGTQAGNNSRYLSGGFGKQMRSDVFVLKTADGELASSYGQKDIEVVLGFGGRP